MHRWTHIAVSFVVGLVFALGLGFSGMTNPRKIKDFLDIFGHWDASLAFVMVGAIGVYAAVYHGYAKRRSGVNLAVTTMKVDWRLIAGAMCFGVGWSLGGLCPGPAITALASGEILIVPFILAMVLGLRLSQLITKS